MTDRRIRILFIGEAVSLAHVARPFVLASALDPSRYEVHFASQSTTASEQVLADQPLIRWDLESIPQDVFRRRLRRGLPLWTTDELERNVVADRRLIRSVQPDLIVSDLRVSMSTSAQLEGVRHASIVNAQWSRLAEPIHQPVPETTILPYLPFVSQLLFDVVRPIAFWLYTRPVNRLRQRFGLPAYGSDGYALYAADDVLYVDSPNVVRMRTPLPANHHFVGPAIWSPQAPLPPWWSTIGHDTQVIYVSLGSSGKLGLLPTILQALEGTRFQVAAAVGGRRTNVDVPRNAHVAPFLPGDALARRAALVIGNGGSPGLYQAFDEGTPVLGIPQNLDQHMAIASVAHLGATLTLRSERLRPKAIREAVERMVDESSFRAAATRIAADFREHPVTTLFPRYVESVVG